MNKVYIVPFHVTPLENSIMPSEFDGAYVSCYAQAASYENAVKIILNKLNDDGLYPKEIRTPIHEMEISEWSVHKVDQWPDYIDNLPDQLEFKNIIESGDVVYGPFGSYKV